MGSSEIDIERAIGKDYHLPLVISAQEKGADIQLYEYYEIPYFLRGNPYITSGYRMYLSNEMCLKRYVENINAMLMRNLWQT